jgi:hypothetical protein
MIVFASEFSGVEECGSYAGNIMFADRRRFRVGDA